MDCPCAIKRQKRTASSSSIVNCMSKKMRGIQNQLLSMALKTPDNWFYYANVCPTLQTTKKLFFILPASHRKGSNEIIHLSPEKLFYNYL